MTSDEVSFTDVPVGWLRIRLEERQKYLTSLKLEAGRKKVQAALTDDELQGVHRDYPNASNWFLAEGELRGLETAQKVLDWSREDARDVT